MAHKKAAGSAKNLRDSNAKYRWVKLFGWQVAKAWNIIIRQKWSKYEAGQNTYLGSDFSVHASIDGIVSFSKKKKLRFDGRKYLKTYVSIQTTTEAYKEIKELKVPAKSKTNAKSKATAKASAKAKKVEKTTEAKPAKKKAVVKAKKVEKTTEAKPAKKKVAKKDI